MKTIAVRMSQDRFKLEFPPYYRDGISLFGASCIIHDFLSRRLSGDGGGPKEFAEKSAVTENCLSFSTPTELALH